MILYCTIPNKISHSLAYIHSRAHTNTHTYTVKEGLNFANGLHGTSHNCQTYIILHILDEHRRQNTAENKRNTPHTHTLTKRRFFFLLLFNIKFNSHFIQVDCASLVPSSHAKSKSL